MTRPIKPVPWLTQPAIHYLGSVVNKRTRVLEFGCGGSTVWFANRTPLLTTIEHDMKWLAKVRDERTRYDYGYRLFGLPYAQACDEFPDMTFDLVLVDGRDRVKCVEAARRIVKPRGVLMVDNMERDGYKPIHDLLAAWDWVHSEQRSEHPTYPRAWTTLPWHTDWWIRPIEQD